MTHGTTLSDIFHGVDGSYLFGSFTWILLILFFLLIVYFFYSYCQYILSKKLGIEDSWMAWIPFLWAFNLVKIAGKSYWWVPLVLLWYMFFYIPGFILSILILHGISTRTGHGAGWTVGLLFLYAIFFPLTAFTYQPNIQPRPL